MITTNIYEMDIYSQISLMGNILAICIGSTIIDQFGYSWRGTTLFPVLLTRIPMALSLPSCS